MKKYCLDTNTLTNPFYKTYPRRLEIFQDMWNLLAINQHRLIIIKPIYDEIIEFCQKEELDTVSNSLVAWLKEHNFSHIPIEMSDENLALQIRKNYKSEEKGDGINKIDSILKKRKNYKIPAVCEERNIRCINLVELLDELSS